MNSLRKILLKKMPVHRKKKKTTINGLLIVPVYIFPSPSQLYYKNTLL